MNANSTIVYNGKSQIDGNKILCVLSGLESKSQNIKTGDMVQSWIIRSDMSPCQAVKTGADRSVCGECKFRSGSGCYVLPHQAPGSVYRAYKRGSYDFTDPRLIPNNKPIRIGSYGDPAALPINVLMDLLRYRARPKIGWTGYTHSWESADPRLRYLVCASVDNLDECARAHSMGWNTFRTDPRSDLELIKSDLLPWETVCPALSGRECADCQLCRGVVKPFMGSIPDLESPRLRTIGALRGMVIPVHGSRSNRARESIARSV